MEKIEEGKYAIFTDAYQSQATGGYQQIVSKQKAPVLIYKIDINGFYCRTDGLLLNNFGDAPFVIPRRHEGYLKTIEKEEAVNITKKLNKTFLIIAKKRAKDLRVKHIKVNLRKDYDLKKKELLGTSLNFCNLYPMNKITEQTGPEVKSLYANWTQCCSFTKDTQDIVVYMPKSWLKYYGYNLTDLRNYLDFLTNCGIGYRSKVLGIVDFNKKFKVENSKKYSLLQNEKFNNYMSENEQAYEVIVRGSNYKQISYLYFLLTRYIYNYQYWNIPFIAMKLKANMPNASNWDCLLLAHNKEIYNSYYSLSTTSENNILMPHKIMNTQKSCLQDLEKGSQVNNAFKIIVNNTGVSIAKLIEEEKYEELQKLLDEFKNK